MKNAMLAAAAGTLAAVLLAVIPAGAHHSSAMFDFSEEARVEFEAVVERFNYKPETQIPYILYNTHQEFEQTNLWMGISEHVLGVTSTTDLKMGLAYWGDHARFRHVSLHEMVHQWQDEAGHTIDHGATFRAKAREVGIAPLARRALNMRAGRMTGSQTVGRRAARQE
jgi:hypothetical protein